MGTLQGKTALVFGAAALGAPAALTLASAGVGRLLLADPAPVGLRDLAGAPLFRADDLGVPRATAAAARLARRFPALALAAFELEDAVACAGAADVVVGAASDVATMFVANDAAAAARRPLVHAGLLRLSAQLLTVEPGRTGCLRCLFEGPPPDGPAIPDDEAPGPLAGLAGALLGAEALRVLAGLPASYGGRLLVLEARSFRTRAVPVRRRSGCAACGEPGQAAGGAP